MSLLNSVIYRWQPKTNSCPCSTLCYLNGSRRQTYVLTQLYAISVAVYDKQLSLLNYMLSQWQSTRNSCPCSTLYCSSGSILQTTVLTQLYAISVDLHRVNFKDDQRCILCGHLFEDAIYFFLSVHFINMIELLYVTVLKTLFPSL